MQEDYQYEDEDIVESHGNKKKIIISILLVIVLILIIILMRSCSKSNDSTKKEINYESILLESSKKYYNYNKDLLPKVKGECSKVELKELLENISNKEDFDSCDMSGTYVQVCKLENGTLHYTPWLKCNNKNSENEYSQIAKGTLKDIKTDESYVSFKFLPRKLISEDKKLGEVEEIWKDEIEYLAYKTLDTITYYRYKDQQWIWNTYSKKYYTSSGDKSSASDVKEYYTSTPASGYTNKDNSATVYKWYKEGSKKREYYTVNGKEAYSATAVGSYNIKDESQVKIEYVYRQLLDTKSSILYYACAKDSTGTVVINQQVPCKNSSGVNTQNSGYTYTIKTYYACPSGYIAERETTNITASTKCYKFAEESGSCPTGTCIKGERTLYKWYKEVGSGERKYYPSGSSSASGEKIYYKDSPASGYVKDENTKTTGYKYFKKVEGQSKYVSESPSSGATKTSSTKWTDWSNWSTKEPNKKSYRNIESRVKIKLQKIEALDDDFEDIFDEYMTFDEIIDLFQKEGYEVKTLSDIDNNGEISYKLEMYIRNKKEIDK